MFEFTTKTYSEEFYFLFVDQINHLYISCVNPNKHQVLVNLGVTLVDFLISWYVFNAKCLSKNWCQIFTKVCTPTSPEFCLATK